jgi:predicted HicB family RNase H-like nuclease
MEANRKDPRSSARERINLRLSPEVLEAIDAECSRRAGSVSRNTWITEAVTERLARLASASRPQGAGGANG